MQSSAKSKQNGDAFEYACLRTLIFLLKQRCDLHVDIGPKMLKAQETFFSLPRSEQETLIEGAKAGIFSLIMYEPKLDHPGTDEPLLIMMNSDKRGEDGDVRDIITVRKSEDWQIGISCKHNNEAVKHSRLSDDIDFGYKWLGHPCSDIYWEDIAPVFNILESWMINGDKWNEHPEKTDAIYVPLLTAFANELKRLSDEFNDVPAEFVKYAIGRYDFYKIITNDAKKYTTLKAFNLYGRMNADSTEQEALCKIPKLPLPDHIHSIGFKRDSKTTLEICMNAGWTFTLRLHNGDGAVKTSLKFDFRLIGQPSSLFSVDQAWKGIPVDAHFERLGIEI